MVRIVAGEFRGWKIHTAPGDWLRPTSDRIKETLFNILQNDLNGASVLDLYSGSGNLGLEAWSRGARHVVCVEKARRGIGLLQRNAERFGLLEKREGGRTFEIVQDSATHYLQSCSLRTWDIILADPPYDAGEETPLMERLSEKVLRGLGWFVLQHGKDWQLADIPKGYELYRQKRFGVSRLEFLRRTEGG